MPKGVLRVEAYPGLTQQETMGPIFHGRQARDNQVDADAQHEAHRHDAAQIKKKCASPLHGILFPRLLFGAVILYGGLHGLFLKRP